ncbi:MAG: hypothetical protein ACC645_11895 [Pirellulales bacterium]
MSTSNMTLDLGPVKSFFSELQSQHTEMEEYLGDSLRELQALRADLDTFEQELQVRTCELEQSRRELEEATESASLDAEKQHAQELAALQANYDTAIEEIGRLEASRGDAGDVAGALKNRIEELSEERDRACADLERSETRSSELESKVELLLQQEGGEGVVTAELDDARNRLEEVLQVSKDQKDQIERLGQERDELENELDTVRARAAELNDALAQIKRESVEERAEWSAELKQMRHVLERQAELLTSAPRQPAAARISASRSHENGSKKAHDPVLGSVMAQFEKIRQERAELRSRRQKEPT